jgi:hypothetical protein
MLKLLEPEKDPKTGQITYPGLSLVGGQQGLESLAKFESIAREEVQNLTKLSLQMDINSRQPSRKNLIDI